MDIGVIGLGHMGQAMARRLLNAGHRLVVYNRTRAKAEPLQEAGATVANHVCDACRGDVVITMVADDPAVEQLVCSGGGVLDCLEPNRTVHLSTSTISPALVQRLAQAHRARSKKFLSAPMLGRPAAAEQGKLFALAAGEPDDIARVNPVFDAFAQKVFVIGTAPEAANLVKLACNTMLAAVLEVIGESVALLQKWGVVDPKTYFEVLLTTLLPKQLYEPYANEILSRDFTPGFRMPLALKDITLALGAGEQHAVPMPIASLLRDHLVEAIAAGYGDLDWAAITLVPQREAGLRPT